MRRIKLVIAAVTGMVAILVASAAPAMAIGPSGHLGPTWWNGWNDCSWNWNCGWNNWNDNWWGWNNSWNDNWDSNWWGWNNSWQQDCWWDFNDCWW